MFIIAIYFYYTNLSTKHAVKDKIEFYIRFYDSYFFGNILKLRHEDDNIITLFE